MTDEDKAVALNWAGFRLRALGRLRKAAEPMQAALENHIKQENWKEAAKDAGNLSELYLTLGDVPKAVEYATAGNLTGGANANIDYLKDKVQIEADLKKAELDILYDAQTSGGLLIALPAESGDNFLNDASSQNLFVAEIGVVVKKDNFSIVVA